MSGIPPKSLGPALWAEIPGCLAGKLVGSCSLWNSTSPSSMRKTLERWPRYLFFFQFCIEYLQLWAWQTTVAAGCSQSLWSCCHHQMPAAAVTPLCTSGWAGMLSASQLYRPAYHQPLVKCWGDLSSWGKQLGGSCFSESYMYHW